jgi:dTDP-4-dehydrorhamnose 3,5-epimerase
VVFRDGDIEGVAVRDLSFFNDGRGWLSELFRLDEVGEGFRPAMSYVSMTLPGVQRGPHAHREQTDYFAFFSSSFKLVLWDGREGSGTLGNRMVLVLGEDNPKFVAIPPGVVHAYRNVGETEGLVLNFPDRLYAGWGKGEPVDEIRYEDDPASVYEFDE